MVRLNPILLGIFLSGCVLAAPQTPPEGLPVSNALAQLIGEFDRETLAKLLDNLLVQEQGESNEIEVNIYMLPIKLPKPTYAVFLCRILPI